MWPLPFRLYLPERCNGAALQEAHVPVDLHLPLEQKNRKKNGDFCFISIHHIKLAMYFLLFHI